MGLGDFKEETFSDEEKAALGEAEEKAPDADKDEQKDDEGPDTRTETDDKPEEDKTEQAAEQPAEEKDAAEEQGLRIETDEKGHTWVIDEDGAKIPMKRFKEVFWKAKEGDRNKEKLDLFKKLGPEGYYQAFPDEKPPDPPKRETPPQAPVQDMGALRVVQPNGPYDGMTLRELYDVDPVFATNLQNDFLWNQRKLMTEAAEKAEQVKKDSARDLEEFGASIGKAAYGKEPKDLTKEEIARVGETIRQVIDWMTTTRRGGGVLMDAYFLMNKEGLLKQVVSRAAEKTIKDLAGRKGPASIDTSGGGGNGKDGSWDAIAKMTEAQLAAKIDAMSEKEMTAFFKEAPKSLRSKYPNMPWG
jgi:hypothetical protein